MQFFKKIFFTISFFTLSLSSYAIVIDGKLNEPEWQNARIINNFTTVKPYSLNTPEHTTTARILSQTEGIYISVHNSQTRDTQITEFTARDAAISSDSNQIILDFDANGISGYSFEIGNGGSIRDGIWRNENSFSNEWDGNWQASTTQDDENWYSEIFIPWGIASMASSSNTDKLKRNIKIYIARNVKYLAKTYANTNTSNERQQFLASFPLIEIDNFEASSLQSFLYVSNRRETLATNNEHNIGGDLFWKSGKGQQISASINPDFGQVESDNLVVNFSPDENFFNERRPFFTQDQALFDVRGTENLRLIHTRRIGGSPDIGEQFASDITGALKYTNNSGLYNYGLLTASEENTSESIGRNYLAGRLIRKTGKLELGYTSTYVDRDSINRTAFVNALDYEYRLNNSLLLNGQYLNSNIKQNGISTKDIAAWLKAAQQISDNQDHSITLSHYGSEFNVNDFGFLPRANLNSLFYLYNWENNDFSENSSVDRHRVSFQTKHRYNDDGEKLITSARILDIWNYKDTSSLNWYLQYFSSGQDDRFTRGNNILKTQGGFEASLTLFTKNTNKFRNHGFIDWTDKYIGGQGISLHIHPSYQFTDNFSTSLGVYYTGTKNWLNWIEDNQIGSYKRRQLRSVLNFDANFNEQHELRLKFQWVALTARAEQGFNVGINGNLSAPGSSIKDFSFTNTALQLRYRYQYAPLSNLFLVYSRGGNIFIDENESFSNLFSESITNPSSNTIFFKIRHQF